MFLCGGGGWGGRGGGGGGFVVGDLGEFLMLMIYDEMQSDLFLNSVLDFRSGVVGESNACGIVSDHVLTKSLSLLLLTQVLLNTPAHGLHLMPRRYPFLRQHVLAKLSYTNIANPTRRSHVLLRERHRYFTLSSPCQFQPTQKQASLQPRTHTTPHQAPTSIILPAVSTARHNSPPPLPSPNSLPTVLTLAMKPHRS